MFLYSGQVAHSVLWCFCTVDELHTLYCFCTVDKLHTLYCDVFVQWTSCTLCIVMFLYSEQVAHCTVMFLYSEQVAHSVLWCFCTVDKLHTVLWCFCTVDKLHTLYCDLLKRLDDNSDDVRIATTHLLKAYIQSVTSTCTAIKYSYYLLQLQGFS